MNEEGQKPAMPAPAGREPIFLLPGAITILAGVLAAVHLASTVVLNPDGQIQLLFWFAFQPYRIVLAGIDPGIAVPLLWTPFSHAFLHAGWDHLLINLAWLVIFATPVVRRYGAGPMLALFLLSAAGGAALFAVTTLYSQVYLIGASGGVAGLTGAAIRFMFQPVLIGRHPETGEQMVLGRRLASVREVFVNPRSRWFTLIWLLLNALVPLVPLLTGTSLSIAWQAHLGGFAAGFLLVGLFERKI
ncbi:rhomboid family intramembrane serine protease [Devosia sp. XJ19-1]|uniref:Rhomboid family intramembrane serine protease n=1 Tax=Devosia ureilytica TaxID=2952754 RepID=A0A9Q4ALQ1_9HYPH|nr:rhomboid family intramembrane serine protease [Devosia ureilytica]MCP8881887.1 rhomboid family intramembrane serine protease [Devosia ureilytica]MCP8886227.1 rhomboid family intramembrane serine protease [Devosia ureilytica]